MQAPWSTIKTFCTTFSIPVDYIDLGAIYYIRAVKGSFNVECYLNKDGGADQIDFETNFKTDGNVKISDVDGTTMVRTKVTTLGWTYQAHFFEFCTGKLASIFESNYLGNNMGYATIKLFDASGSQITDQSIADANCTMTQIDFEPTYDIDMVGGQVRIYESLTDDVRLWVVAVPDVPATYGGCKQMVTGANLRYYANSQPITADGRAAKHLVYSSTQHTNKLRFIIRHPVGVKADISVMLEYFKE